MIRVENNLSATFLNLHWDLGHSAELASGVDHRNAQSWGRRGCGEDGS